MIRLASSPSRGPNEELKMKNLKIVTQFYFGIRFNLCNFLLEYFLTNFKFREMA